MKVNQEKANEVNMKIKLNVNEQQDDKNNMTYKM